MDKQQLINDILAWSPVQDRQILETMNIEMLKNVLANAVTTFQEQQAERLLDIKLERATQQDEYKRKQFEAGYQQRRAEATANEKENKRVFSLAARQYGFSEAEANFSVLQSALGTLTSYAIQQFLATNPTALAPAAPEQIEQWSQEREAQRVKDYNKRLLTASPYELREIAKQEHEQRGQAKQAEIDRMIKETDNRDASVGFQPIPERNLETGEFLDSGYFMRLSNTNMAGFRQAIKKWGSANVTARIRGTR
jgi:hypothetical protein